MTCRCTCRCEIAQKYTPILPQISTLEHLHENLPEYSSKLIIYFLPKMLYNVGTQCNSIAASNAQRSPFSAEYQAYDIFKRGDRSPLLLFYMIFAALKNAAFSVFYQTERKSINKLLTID